MENDFLKKMKQSLETGVPHEDLNVINEITRLAEQKEIIHKKCFTTEYKIC